MPRRITGTVLLTLGICSTGAFARPALADPLTFANVSASDTASLRLGLFEDPAQVFTLDDQGLLVFWVDIQGSMEPGQIDVLRLTFRAFDGETLVQEYGVPVFGTVPPPLTLLTSRSFPITYAPRPYELTVDLLNSAPDFVIPGGASAGARVDSFTYSFSTVSPVPEPGTMVLLGSGLTLLLRKTRAHLRASRS